MALKSGAFTAQEKAFAEAYANLQDTTQAAKVAGYKVPSVAGWRTLQRPEVVAEIGRLQQQRLHTELVPLALNHLAAVLQDASASHRDKNQAASIVLRQTGAGDAASLGDRQPHEMTAAELDARIEQIRREQAARAVKVIDAEPTQSVDLFD